MLAGKKRSKLNGINLFPPAVSHQYIAVITLVDNNFKSVKYMMFLAIQMYSIVYIIVQMYILNKLFN